MTKRRPRVKFITDGPRSGRRNPNPGRTPSLCIDCMRPIDRGAVLDAISRGVSYAHGCGRNLA